MVNPTKIQSKLMAAVLVSLLLVACKSTPMKDKAAVEDKSTGSNVTQQDENAVKEVAIDSNNVSDSNNPLKDPNNILSKRNIYFDYNSDSIRSEYRDIIAAHGKYLQSHADAKVILQGNTDERGTREYNLSLGQRRSVAVKTALNLLGVPDSQIETVSYGEEKATPNCADEDCYQQNRRVDIVYANE